MATQSSLKALLVDGRCSNSVRKILAQTVAAMAVQGFLDPHHNNGDFVSFLLKLCTLPNGPAETR